MDTLADRFELYLHDRYHAGAMSELVRSCHLRYLHSARLLRIQDDLTNNIKSSWDHRTVSACYFLSAKRFKTCCGLEQPALDFAGSEGAFNELCTTWDIFWDNFCKELVQDDNFVLDICNATAFQNTETGRAAEQRLHDRLVDWYLSDEGAWPKLFEARFGKA